MNFVPHILTIGHSTHSWETFLKLLLDADVTAVADVRSSPYSRHTPQFNKDALAPALKESWVNYVFMGGELGGRPSRPHLYRDGIADYRRMAEQPEFQAGIDRLMQGAQSYRIALMCAEREPLDCHRCLLVGRALAERGAKMSHILANGRVEEQWETEERLLAAETGDSLDMFRTREEQVAIAYDKRSARVAYAEAHPEAGSIAAA